MEFWQEGVDNAKGQAWDILAQKCSIGESNGRGEEAMILKISTSRASEGREGGRTRRRENERRKTWLEDDPGFQTCPRVKCSRHSVFKEG